MAKRKNELKVMLLAGVTSAVLLATTAFAAANTVSGFEDIKEAIFKLAKTENYTAESTVELKIDGNIITSNLHTQKKEDSLNISFSSQPYNSHIQDEEYTIIVQDGIATDRKSSGGFIASSSNGSTSIFVMGGGMKEMTNDQIRLANLLMDLAAGDTKNYFYNNNGNITLNLEGNQIPELVQLSTSVMAELMGEEERRFKEERGDYEITDIPVPVANALIDKIICDVKLDEEGNFEYIETSVTMLADDMDGVSHTYEFISTVNISDIGTTILDKTDLSQSNGEVINSYVERRN